MSNPEEYREASVVPSRQEESMSAEQQAELILQAGVGEDLEIDDHAIALKLIMFFKRPKDDVETIKIFDPSKGETVETVRPFSRPLPLLSEFSHLIGLTEDELELLARRYPRTIGRAVKVARDVQTEYVTHRGLSGDYHPRYAEFVSINLTNLKKEGRSNDDLALNREELSGILDEIEDGQKRLYEPPKAVTPAGKSLLGE